jgi:hypothetical protein
MVGAIAIAAMIVYAMRWIPDRCIEKGWDDRLRIAGGILQCLGIGVALAGMRAKGKLFHLGSLWEDLRSLKFVRLLRNYFHLGVGGSAEIHGELPSLQGSASATAGGSATARGLPSDHDRLVALEEQQRVTDARVRAVEREFGAATEELRTAINAERKVRDDQTHELRETIRQAVVGDINLDYAGVLLLLIGILLSNYSPELAKLF